MKRWAAVFALLVGLVAVSPPAHASITWRGSHKLRRHDVESVYKKLPARGKDVDVQIWVIDGRDWPAIDALEGEGILGFYEPTTHRLFLRSDYTGFAVVAAHELGHHAYFSSFTAEERKSWETFWKEHQEDMPRDYARVNAEEGFAECFAATYVGVLKQEGAKPIPPVVDHEIRSFFA